MKQPLEAQKTKFSEIFLENQKSLVEFYWVNQEHEMSENDFKNALLLYLQVINLYQPAYVIVNAETLAFAIAPALQIWVDNEISAKTNKIIKKMAVILPKEFIGQLAIKQVLGETEGQKIQVQYFSHYEEALDWIGIF